MAVHHVAGNEEGRRANFGPRRHPRCTASFPPPTLGDLATPKQRELALDEAGLTDLDNVRYTSSTVYLWMPAGFEDIPGGSGKRAWKGAEAAPNSAQLPFSSHDHRLPVGWY